MCRSNKRLSAPSLAVWYEELSEPRTVAARHRCAFVQAMLESRTSHFILQVRSRPLVIQPLTIEYQSQTAQAYRAIWYYADAYREVWTEAEALSALSALSECFVAVDELDSVVALAGGKPLRRCNNDQLGAAVTDLGRAYYLAELGRLPVIKGTRVGTCLFELIMLTAIYQGYDEFVLNTAGAADVFAPDNPNPARKLYEDHGFQLLCDLDENILGQAYTRMRSSGQTLTDQRLYYYATANSFFEKVGLRGK